MNNLHRWYDPAVGRWLSEDPIGFGGGDANLYRYVGNESTGATDPDGLKKDPRFDWSHFDGLSIDQRLGMVLTGDTPLLSAGGKLPKWTNMLVAPNNNKIRCANASARAEIRVNYKYLKQDLVTKLMGMLTKTPPLLKKDPDRITPAKPKTADEFLLAANQFADLYIRSVDKFLATHPGARPKLGSRSTLLDALGVSNSKNAPWCADWAAGMETLLFDRMAMNPLLMDVFNRPKHTQYLGDSEHNFVIVSSYGYDVQYGTADPNILRLDPWWDLLPKAYPTKKSPYNYPTNPLK